MSIGINDTKHVATVIGVLVEEKLGLLSYCTEISRSRILEALIVDFVNVPLLPNIEQVSTRLIANWNRIKSNTSLTPIAYIQQIKNGMQKKKLANRYQEQILEVVESGIEK